MKRFLSLTLVAIMLLSTLMLTSCDALNQAKDFVHGLLGISEEEKEEVITTITEDEWVKAYSLNNFTITMSQEYDGYGMDMSMAVTADAAKVSMKYVTAGGNMDVEAYFDIKEGYEITPDGQGKWIGSKTSSSIVVDIVGLEEFLSEISFSDLVYEEDSKSYVYDDTEDETIYTFYFENGSIIRIIATSTDPEYPASLTVENIGTTIVTLPEYTKED